MLAKVKSMQGKLYEALVLYKRLLEINADDYESAYAVAQMFDTTDQSLALNYYEIGIKTQKRLIEDKADELGVDIAELRKRPELAIKPEHWCNVGVLRME